MSLLIEAGYSPVKSTSRRPLSSRRALYRAKNDSSGSEDGSRLTRRQRVDSYSTAGWFSASLVTSVSPSLATSGPTSVSSSVLMPSLFSVFTSCLISLLTRQLWQMRRLLSVSPSCLTPPLPLRWLWVLGGALSGLGSLKLSCSC